MTTPGVASVCFSCGQPLGAPAAASEAPKGYALTGALPSAIAPPVDPYGASSARLVGPAGDFPLTVAEAAVGRDPARCRVVLTEPRVSGVHAHVRLLEGSVQVRDGGSNNGTYVDGARIPAEVWVSVRVGAEVRFGPVTFTVMR
jgi:pSer/pThr/pTyr-binding forkhead associated (FHA) protein